jgi:hypothetical protein
MFRKNDDHRQAPLISDLDLLLPKQRERLEKSWAGTFYHEFFVRIDERVLAVLYSDQASRPNIAVNVLFGLEVLKSGYGWSDEELYDHFGYDLQVRYALGYRNLGEGHFELRTLYNFRARLAAHRERTGENLVERIFEQISDEQVAAFKLNSQHLRMDSTQISSNIRQASRLQLLVEIVQRVQRMLIEADQARYEVLFQPYIQGSAGQYIYRLKGESYDDHLQRIGQVMQTLIAALAEGYGDQASYQLLVRVFAEHFSVDDDEADPRPKSGQQLAASSLQSPDDPVATYRHKAGEDFVGYVANLTETCHPDNPLQLVLKVQVEPNTADDAQMLADTLPDLKQRTDVDRLYTDGTYGSPTVDELNREHHIEQIQTAIRGRPPAADKLTLADFTWEIEPDQGTPVALITPQGQRVEIEPGRKPERYIARLPQASPEAQRPAVIYFSQANLEVALRRQRTQALQTQDTNPRAAVESTIAALKRPFSADQLPVRGPFRVAMMLLLSAAMLNVRRIWRFQSGQNQDHPNQPDQLASFGPFLWLHRLLSAMVFHFDRRALLALSA